MNKLIIAVLALIACTNAVAEEDRHAKAMARVNAHLQEVQERLQLSDEQMEHIRPILKSDAEERLTVVQKYGVDEDGQRKRPSRKDMKAMRGDIQMINERTYEALSSVLNDEQLDEYRQIQSERRAQMREQARSR